MLAATAARLSPSDRVLEIGCGTGGTAIRLAPGVGAWIATDFSEEMVRIARAKPGAETVTFRVADAAEAIGDGPFDAICAFNVLHLVEDLPGMLASVHDNLRPGGELIAKVWCFAEVRPLLRALFILLRLVGLSPVAHFLTQAQLREALGRAGLEIVEHRVFGAHPQNPFIVARRPAA